MDSLTLEALCALTDADLRLVVIGDPIEHSLSPPMQNAGLEFLHLPYRYGRLRVSPEDLGGAFQILREKDFIGWNLTLPHKLRAIGLLDGLDPLAERPGAVNTVAPGRPPVLIQHRRHGISCRDLGSIRVRCLLVPDCVAWGGWRDRSGSGALFSRPERADLDPGESTDS